MSGGCCPGPSPPRARASGRFACRRVRSQVTRVRSQGEASCSSVSLRVCTHPCPHPCPYPQSCPYPHSCPHVIHILDVHMVPHVIHMSMGPSVYPALDVPPVRFVHILHLRWSTSPMPTCHPQVYDIVASTCHYATYLLPPIEDYLSTTNRRANVGTRCAFI